MDGFAFSRSLRSGASGGWSLRSGASGGLRPFSEEKGLKPRGSDWSEATTEGGAVHAGATGAKRPPEAPERGARRLKHKKPGFSPGFGCYLRKLAVSIRLSALASFASASISSLSLCADFLRSSAASLAASARSTLISSAHSQV